MRRSTCQLYKMPKNMGVAPRYDIWNERYEPWEHMKRMGRLVGTGFYIPPDWYNHFCMFPPINQNFQQERTLNPQVESEPTQDSTDHLSAERIAVRDEIARKSRLVASEGMRYYNIFWIRKPLDRMEKEYYALKRNGIPHDVAIKKVLQVFYDELTAKKRVAAIQAEEAKLSGKFITMREATVVMKVLTQLQRDQLTPHQATMLATGQREVAHHGDSFTASVSRVTSQAPSAGGAATKTGSTGEALSANALADLLAEAGETATSAGTYRVDVKDSLNDSVKQMQEVATDRTGSADWYSGASPFIELTKE